MRKILLLAVMLVVWFLPGIPVSADTQEEILAQSGADSIAVDEQTNSFLEDHAISFTDPQSALTKGAALFHVEHIPCPAGSTSPTLFHLRACGDLQCIYLRAGGYHF